MAIYSDRPRRYSPPYNGHYRYEGAAASSIQNTMNPDLAQWNNRVKNLDEAWASAARYHSPPQQHHPVHISPPRNTGPPPPPPAPNPPTRSRHEVPYEQAIRYSPQSRTASNPVPPYRSGYPSPTSLPSHSRSYSQHSSRPPSSHASDGPPLAPPPPPLSFISYVRHQRRRSSNTKETPKVLSRRSKLWPPEGYSKHDGLHQKEAEKLIARGASRFTGYDEDVKHAPGHYRFFAIMDSESNARSDKATFEHPSFENITLPMDGSVNSAFPWMSLEQPSMASAFGKSPGTTTLTYYVGKSGSLQAPVYFASKAKARKMKLIAILERLRDLEMQGLQDDVKFQQTYHFLYEKLIDDPERDNDPHYSREKQIADLLTVLSNPEWIDFGVPRNQVVAKYFDSDDEKIKRKFFHQLLLATELHLRIEAPDHEQEVKTAILAQLPPKVAWDLALARRWLEHMSIERMTLSETQSTFTFTLTNKKTQKEALWKFAQLLKWPNLDELGYILEEKDSQEKSIEDRSADAMSWFTGVILPGPTLPWLLMNTLIDCDRDTGDELNSLTHMHPNSGFQYRANTYWSSQCIVGKVLGASRGVRQVAGWIGPCYYTPELDRAQCVIVRQLEPLDQRLTPRDITSMDDRTSPLGPESDEYPVRDYDLIIPDPQDVEDIIRIQKLSFNPHKTDDSRGNKVFDAAIVFAFAENSLPIRLKYNVDFISAFPCVNGPHPLYFEYKHRIVRVDDGLAELTNWASVNNLTRSSRRSRTSSPAMVHGTASPRNLTPTRSTSRSLVPLTDGLSLNDLPLHLPHSRSASPAPAAAKAIREVLVIEAFGVSDNEVFARAWCAQQGVGALVANARETCVACAVREAFAACVSVVILTEGGSEKEEDKAPC